MKKKFVLMLTVGALVFGFGAGYASFAVPDNIRRACVAAVAEEPPKTLTELKQVLKERCGVESASAKS